MHTSNTYRWSYGWSGSEEPVVTPLMHAILEKNVPEMEKLFEQGDTWEELDDNTLRRALYFVVDDYSVMECLVNHGFSVIKNYVRRAKGLTTARVPEDCISPEGFTSGLCGKAYFAGAYDVLELLAAQGFDAFYCYEQGWAKARKADEEIFTSRDERAIQIMLEHGHCPDFEYYEEYVLNKPQIPRKSLGLSGHKFRRSIPNCGQEKVPLFFGRGQVQARNARRREDHEDLLRARRELEQQIGMLDFNTCLNYTEAQDRKMSDILRKLTASL